MQLGRMGNREKEEIDKQRKRNTWERKKVTEQCEGW
jgi:hypothetical protein